MAQRLTAQRQLYFGVESTEGVEVVGGAANALLVTNLTINPDRAFNARSFVGQMGGFTGKMGSQPNPTLSFTLECRGGAAGSSVVPAIDPLLKTVFAIGTQDIGATTVQAGSTATVVNVASAANFSAGNAVAIETGSGTGTWEVGWILAPNTAGQNTLTLTHALTFTPTTGATVKPSITYKPQSVGHGSLSFQMYLDSTNRVSFVGCKGTLKLDAPAPGAVPVLTFNWKAINWLDTGSVARPTPTYDTAIPPTPYKFKLDATPYDVKLANWDLRQMIARKRSQNSTFGTIAEVVTDRDLRGFLQAYDVDESQFTNWNSGLEQAVAQQFGNTQFNMVAYQIPKAQRVAVGYGDDNGLTTDEIVFEGNVTSGADEIRLAFL